MWRLRLRRSALTSPFHRHMTGPAFAAGLLPQVSAFMTTILSIHCGAHDSAAALFDDYRVVAAVQKERLSRTKKQGGEPEDCIAEVLDIGGITKADVDVVVFSRAEFPRTLFKTDMLRRLRDSLTGRDQGLRDVSVALSKAGQTQAQDMLDIPGVLAHYGLPAKTRVHFANHHGSHALPALFFTDWDQALIYTADGAGDNVNYSHRVFKDGQLTCLHGDDRLLTQPYRNDSLAQAYAKITKALGFRPLHHEGKITGLAAFGRPVLKDLFAAHFHLDSHGVFSSDFTSSDQMLQVLTGECQGQSREDVAASIQAALEDLMLASVSRLLDTHKVHRLGLGGGLFANVKLNQRLAEHCGLDEIFIVPPMGDEGLVIGGALDYLLHRDGMAEWCKRRYRLDNVYWGRPFGTQTGPRIQGFSQRIARVEGDPVQTAARLLTEGKAVATVAARMEYGPRALGARTIMASPSRRDINDSLNTRLDRSEFMPFAPVVAEEDAAQLFDVTSTNAYACRFMTITCDVKRDWSERIPAVVHVDNTARPQIIRRADNPLYYDTLAAFKAASGLAAAVNTSFNVHEEPIINTPEEAAKALVDNRVDYLLCDDGVYGVA